MGPRTRVHNLSQISPIFMLMSLFFKICFNILLTFLSCESSSDNTKNSVDTLQETEHFGYTYQFLLMFPYSFAVYSENQVKPIRTLCWWHFRSTGTVIMHSPKGLHCCRQFVSSAVILKLKYIIFK